jgi:alkanesulfonate monooxygenase SsuD/methylene tetrahydromethanopterin reductase-like flavin-dependent oxidoreductase (luciferase family)
MGRVTGADVPLGVVLRDPLPWDEALDVVRTAEDTGYEAVFVPEIQAREAFATLAGFAANTERIRLGTGIVTVASRAPATTAMAAATVHEASGGRMILGIGSGGATRDQHPLALVQDYARFARAALAGEPARSERFGVDGFELGVALPSPVPVWLAALGDRMIALAGRVADGVLLNWCTPERVASARAALAASAEAAGRDPSEVTVAVYVRACLGVEEDLALGPLRSMAGMYASFPAYARQMEAMGLGEDATRAAAAHAARSPEGVPESLVRALTVTGDRKQARARFDAYRDAGADLVLCYPVAVDRDAYSSVLGTVLAAAPTPAVER